MSATIDFRLNFFFCLTTILTCKTVTASTKGVSKTTLLRGLFKTSERTTSQTTVPTMQSTSGSLQMTKRTTGSLVVHIQSTPWSIEAVETTTSLPSVRTTLPSSYVSFKSTGTPTSQPIRRTQLSIPGSIDTTGTPTSQPMVRTTKLPISGTIKMAGPTQTQTTVQTIKTSSGPFKVSVRTLNQSTDPVTSLTPITQTPLIQSITDTENHFVLYTTEPLTTPILMYNEIQTYPNIEHPVEEAWVPFAPRLMYDYSLGNEDTFTLIDGNLARILTNRIVYGDIGYDYESWRMLLPVILAILLLLTIILSFLVIRKNGKESQMNKCSTILLVCIALFDIVTIACAMAENMYLYRKRKENFGTLPFESCQTMSILQMLSSLPHTISLWLALLLSAQRYVCVSKPFSAKEWITLRKTTTAVLFIIIFAIAFHLPKFVDVNFKHVAIRKEDYSGEVIITCDAVYSTWIKDVRVYESTYLWTRFVLVKFVPCILMTSFSFIIFRILKTNISKGKHYKKGQAKHSLNKLSAYIVIVTLIIVIAEIPIGVLSCVYALSISINITIISYDTLKRISVIADAVLYISYCLVFLIYCLMTKNVRTFISSCVSRVINRISGYCSKDGKDIPHSQNLAVLSTLSIPSSTSKSSNEQGTVLSTLSIPSATSKSSNDRGTVSTDVV